MSDAELVHTAHILERADELHVTDVNARIRARIAPDGGPHASPSCATTVEGELPPAMSDAELVHTARILERADELHVTDVDARIRARLAPGSGSHASPSGATTAEGALPPHATVPPHVSAPRAEGAAAPRYNASGLTVRTVVAVRPALAFERAIDRGRTCLRDAGHAALQVADPAADSFDAPLPAASRGQSRMLWRKRVFDAVAWGGGDVHSACDVDGLAKAAIDGVDVTVVACGPTSGGQGEYVLGASGVAVAIGRLLVDFAASAAGARVFAAAVRVDDHGVFCCGGASRCAHRGAATALPSAPRGADGACWVEMLSSGALTQIVAAARAAQRPAPPSTVPVVRHAAVEFVLRLHGAIHARVLLLSLAGRDCKIDAALRALSISAAQRAAVVRTAASGGARRQRGAFRRTAPPRPVELHECVRLRGADSDACRACAGIYDLIAGEAIGECGVYRRSAAGADAQERGGPRAVATFLFRAAESRHWMCADAAGMRAGAGWLTSVERNALSPVGLTFRRDGGHPTLAPIDRSIVVELVERISHGASPPRRVVLPGESAGGAHTEDVEFAEDATADGRSVLHFFCLHFYSLLLMTVYSFVCSFIFCLYIDDFCSGPLFDALRDARHQLRSERAMARDAIAELVALRLRDAHDAEAYRALHRDALKRIAGFHRGVAARLRRALGEGGGDRSAGVRGGTSVSSPGRQGSASAVARRKVELRQTLLRSPPRASRRLPLRTRGRARDAPVPRAPQRPEVRLRTLRSPPRRSPPRRSPRSVQRVAHFEVTAPGVGPLPSAAPLASEVGQSLVALADVLAARGPFFISFVCCHFIFVCSSFFCLLISFCLLYPSPRRRVRPVPEPPAYPSAASVLRVGAG